MRILNVLAAMSLATACATQNAPLSEQKVNYPRLDVAVIDTDDSMIISLEQADTNTYMAPVVLPPGTTAGQAAAAGAAGGLFAALIMAGIQSAERADASKDILPVQEALGDVRFGVALREELVNSLSELDWTSIEDVQVIDVEEQDALRNMLSATDAPGVLTLATSNYLSRNASTLIFSARATILPKPAEASRSGKVRIPAATFVTTVAFEVPSPVAGNRRDDFLPTWAENNAEIIRAAAAQAQPVLAEMFVRQLSEGNIPIQKPEGAKWEKRLVHFYGTPLNSRVEVLDRRSDGDLVRVEGGTLRFLASKIAPLEETEPEVSEPAGMRETQPDDIDAPLASPISASADERDLLKDFRMAPIGDDAGLPGRFDKIDQSAQ